MCNHPDLFEPRPTLTSLKMTGIAYTTASLVLTVLDANPLDTVNLYTMNLLLTQLEFSLSAFAGHRVRQLQTPRSLIVEIDSYTPQETPLLFPPKSEVSPPSQNGLVLKHKKPNRPLEFRNHIPGEQKTYPEPETLCPGYAGLRYNPPSEQDSYNAYSSTENTSNTYTTVGSSVFGVIRDSGYSLTPGHVAGDIKPVGTLSFGSRTLLKAMRTPNASEVRAYGSMNGHVSASSAGLEEQKKYFPEKASDGTPGKPVGLSCSPFTMVSMQQVMRNMLICKKHDDICQAKR